ncbi:MAG: ABC transporter permease subunit [Bacteroidota bacterium]
MLHLLQLEWLKWRRHRAFQIFMVAYAILLPAGLLLGKQLPDLPDPIGTTEVLFIFPTVWQYLSFVGNWVSFFLFGFLSIVMVTSEYSFKTVRQNIMTGLTRKQFLLGKIYLFGLLALLATLYYTVVALGIGYFHTDVIRWGKVWQNASYIPRYFLLCFGYMSFGLLVGFLVRRTGLALFLYFAYATIGELILRWGIHFQLIQNKTIHYYPIKSFSDLSPLPFQNLAEEFMRKEGFPLFLGQTEVFIVAIIYIALMIFLVFRRFLKVDL